MAGKNVTPQKPASQTRVGRERLGAKSGRKRGLGPLDKWVRALEKDKSHQRGG